jgi:hypothetical protein
MVGERLAPCTVMVKGGRDALKDPSDTEIVIPEEVPALPGVPDRRPEAASKLAQAGLPAIENVSLSPSGSEAAGWNA